MKRFVLSTCVIAAYSLAFATGPVLSQGTSTKEAAEMKAAIETLMEVPLAPGLAVAALRGEDVVLVHGFGLADVEAKRPVMADSMFYIASATKPFVGTAAAILDHRGRFDLEATLASYLPLATYHDEVDPAAITMCDLLTHAHGIRNEGPITFRLAFSGQHTPELLRRLLKHHGPANDGVAFEYGNIGYNILSMAMDAQLDTSWKEVLRNELFQPLGMESTTGYVSRVASGLCSRTEKSRTDLPGHTTRRTTAICTPPAVSSQQHKICPVGSR